MKPPTADELVGPPPHDLDQEWALKNFLGKTQKEAIEMFKNSAVTEDFSYLASAGLCYYLPAALTYLKSEEATGVSAETGVEPCVRDDRLSMPWSR